MYNNKIDKLDALILLAGDVLIEKNLNSDLLNGASSVSRPKSLDRKIARMIRHEKRHPYNEALIMLKQTAAAVLVICTLMFTLAMSVDAVREAFWNSVAARGNMIISFGGYMKRVISIILFLSIIIHIPILTFAADTVQPL